jgi:zinc protease
VNAITSTIRRAGAFSGKVDFRFSAENATPQKRSLPRTLVALAAGTMLALAATASAQAMTIERVVSPGGIEAWLVHDRTLPLIAIEFAIRGSADQDPADKPGVASMATSLYDEGAGPLNATAFHDVMERRRSSSASAAGATISAAPCARSRTTATKPSTFCGWH